MITIETHETAVLEAAEALAALGGSVALGETEKSRGGFQTDVGSLDGASVCVIGSTLFASYRFQTARTRRTENVASVEKTIARVREIARKATERREEIERRKLADRSVARTIARSETVR